MKKHYDCDGGSIAIGTKECRSCFPNKYGDGCFSVKVISTEKQKKTFNEHYSKWRYVGSVEGTGINVYDYDCLHGDELEDESHILFTLNGRYGVYCNNGKIILDKWN